MYSVDECCRIIKDKTSISDGDAQELLPSGTDTRLRNRVYCDSDSASVVCSGIIWSYGARNCRMGKKWSWRFVRMGVCRGVGFGLGAIRLLRVFGIRGRGFLLEQVAESMDDYRGFVEDFLRKTYMIGGEIILPKHARSINQARGVNPLICDRFDLTLECVR